MHFLCVLQFCNGGDLADYLQGKHFRLIVIVDFGRIDRLVHYRTVCRVCSANACV